MAVIPNKWVKQEKVKVKSVAKDNDAPKHTPTLCRANMQRSLRGVRK